MVEVSVPAQARPLESASGSRIEWLRSAYRRNAPRLNFSDLVPKMTEEQL
jgi:hypothetical protein